MTFEEWWNGYKDDAEFGLGVEDIAKSNMFGLTVVAKDAWDAATYAMNQEQGIAANEGEKRLRLQVAVQELGEIGVTPKTALAIVQKAQG